MKLSIIIPALNEEKTILEVLGRVKMQELPGWEKEIILIDDGSEDMTGEIAGREDSVKLVRHGFCRGKGAAVASGLKEASGDFVLIQDADLEYDPADWPLLLQKIESGESRVVFGSRNLNPGRRGYASYVLGVWLLTKLANILFGARLTDIYTCYKIVPLALAREIGVSSAGFEMEAEITAKILKRGIGIEEVPISYRPRKFSEGKKIRWRDGVRGAATLFRCRFGGLPQDEKSIKF